MSPSFISVSCAPLMEKEKGNRAQTPSSSSLALSHCRCVWGIAKLHEGSELACVCIRY